MSEDIKQKLLEYLQSIETFAKEETPLLVKEFIQWQVMSGAILSVIWLVAALALLYGAKKLWGITKETGAEPIIMIPLVISIFPFFLSTEKALQAVKASYAPRVVIIEKIGEVLK